MEGDWRWSGAESLGGRGDEYNPNPMVRIFSIQTLRLPLLLTLSPRHSFHSRHIPLHEGDDCLMDGAEAIEVVELQRAEGLTDLT
jgi:hypothetical protein